MTAGSMYKAPCLDAARFDFLENYWGLQTLAASWSNQARIPGEIEVKRMT